MAFEVETGTGSSTATSYATVAQLESYWADRGITLSTETTANKQSWLIKATEYIDNTYTFEGDIVSEDQALEWPRFGCYKRGEYPVESDEIPTALINATCYLAYLAKTNELNPIDDGVKSESYGPVSKTYSKTSAHKDYPAVTKLLKYFLVNGMKLQRVN